MGLEQRDLADAAEVTESYISQLLSRKKLPPAPERTDIYGKFGKLLKLPAGKLAGLAAYDAALISSLAPPESPERAFFKTLALRYRRAAELLLSFSLIARAVLRHKPRPMTPNRRLRRCALLMLVSSIAAVPLRAQHAVSMEC